jgi:hypothetical protein
MMYDEATASMGGEATTIEKPKKPKTRAQRILEWRKAHRTEYMQACEDHCTCTPTRAQALIMEAWHNPPID